MKKILLAAILIIVAFTTHAQLAFTYRAGVNTNKSSYKITWPKITRGFSNTFGVDYYLPYKKNDAPTFKLSVNYVTSKVSDADVKDYATQNKIYYTSYKLSKQSSSGIMVTGGVRYVLTQSKKAKVAFALEGDFGAFISNGQVLNYYSDVVQNTKTIEGSKTLFVWNPHVDMYGKISSGSTFKIMAGYSNITGVNAGIGFILNKTASKSSVGNHCPPWIIPWPPPKSK
jgi:hypothetical protein